MNTLKGFLRTTVMSAVLAGAVLLAGGCDDDVDVVVHRPRPVVVKPKPRPVVVVPRPRPRPRRVVVVRP